MRAIRTEAELARLVQDVREFLDSPPVTIKHDPRYLAGRLRSPGVHLRACILRDHDGGVAGISLLISEPTRLVFSLGPLALARPRMQRLLINVAPAFAESVDNGLREALSADLIELLMREFAGHSALLVQAVAIDAPLTRYVAGGLRGAKARPFWAVRHGKHQRHYCVSMPGSLSEYLTRFGRSTRKDLRRTLARIERDSAGHWSLRSYSGPTAVAEFVQQATAVSDRTWQALDEHAGLRRRHGLQQTLEEFAGLGWFRGYVLFLGDRPVGFKLGYLYRGIYFSETTGYDPEFARLQVGVVMVLRILEDLAATGLAPGGIDLDSTENDLKRRLSDRSTLEGSYYLFPRTWRGTLMAAALGAANGASELGVRVLGRLRDLRDKTWARAAQGSPGPAE